MNLSDYDSNATAEGAALERLQADYRFLKNLFNWALIGVLVIAGSLFLFLLREISLARRQAHQLDQYVTEYETRSLPVMEDFRLKLENYSHNHPDFAPVLRKYFGGTNSVPSEPVSGPAIRPAGNESAPPNKPPGQ